ncbi:MAG: hypothetical protein J7619_11575 [Dyadobacter sp.]|uniref:hypothetical protein n=1 Tax=Dyadobacter sp. TaxID=1914288 RepID=UPI001B15A4B0|nr:hypothetical protein [Dyadobacter sp.]MBO9613331.1 hypothetical protein [Dyadobacter sp.]
MKALFTRKTVASICILMVAGLPWSCVKDHDPLVKVTCSCDILDNSGPIGKDTRTLDCPGGKYTCKCGDLAHRGGIAEFHCD